MCRRLRDCDAPQILYDYYSGMGVRNLSQKYHVSKVTMYRYLRDKTEKVYSTINRLFKDSRIGNIQLNFGSIWEADEKIIPVDIRKWYASGFPIYSVKRKKSRMVGQIIIENLVDTRTHFVLASEPLLNMSGDEIARAWILAKERTGRWPAIIRCDKAYAHVYAFKEYLSGHLRIKILPKKGEASQVHLVEGYHRVMDRKLESGIHGGSTWLIHGVWLHYNFVERKESLGDRTPFEVAVNNEMLVDNGWEFLFNLVNMQRRFLIARRI